MARAGWGTIAADYLRLGRAAIAGGRVLRRHSGRTPDPAGISTVEAEFSALLGRRSDRLGLIALLAGRFAAGHGETTLALSRLARAAGRGRLQALAAGRVAAAFCRRLMFRPPGAEAAGADAGPAEAEAIDAIAAAVPVAALRRQLQVYAALARRDQPAALAAAAATAGDSRARAAEFLQLVDRALDRPAADPDALTAAIAAAGAVMALPENAGAVMDLRIRFADRPERLAAIGLAPIDEATFGSFLRTARFRDLMRFLGHKHLFLSARPEAEPLRLAALDETARRLGRRLRLGNRPVTVLLGRFAQTRRFWEDAAFREHTLRRLERLLVVPLGGNRRFVLASAAFLRGDLAAAARRLAGSAAHERGAVAYRAAAMNFHAVLPAVAVPLDAGTPDFAELPPRTDAALVCCADGRYFRRHARAYLTTLRRSGSRMRVHFHIARAGGATGEAVEAEARQLAAADGAVSLSFETPPVAQPAYYASMRFLHGPAFLDRVAGTVILTDIDVRFREAPAAFATAFADSDLGLRLYDRVRIVRTAADARGERRALLRYPRLQPWAQINAACVVLRETAAGRQAAERIAADMAAHLAIALARGGRPWWIDQNALFYSWRQLAGGACRIANVEDAGLPYGSFDYRGSEAGTVRSPVFLRAEAEAGDGGA